VARYRKVDSRIWNDEKFRSLSDDGQLVFLFLLTHPHQTALGAMRATVSGLAEEKGWLPESLPESLPGRFDKAFTEVLLRGMVRHDAKASCVWLPNFLKYNRPESPNVVKAWASAADLIPECALKIECIQSAKAFLKGFKEAFRKAFREAFGEGYTKDYALSGSGAGAVTGAGADTQEQRANPADDDPCGSEGKPADRDPTNREAFERLRAGYPLGTYPQSDWLLGEREACKRVEEGEEGSTWADLEAGVLRYRDQLVARGKLGTEFVYSPKNFFTVREKRWRDPWPLPRTTGKPEVERWRPPPEPEAGTG
jgi:hypothetical protein